MSSVERLLGEGYHLREEAVQDAYPNVSYQELSALVLQSDFRKNALLRPYFAADINTCDASLQGPAVVQVSSVANITQPAKRQNEDNKPRLLRIKVTDGHVSATAIEYESIPALSAHTVPGTKLLLQGNIRVVNGKILLTRDNCRVLGGRVDHLYEAWQANRSTYNQRKKNKDKSSGGDGAPPKFEIVIARAVAAAASTAVAIAASDATKNQKNKKDGHERKKSEHAPKNNEKKNKKIPAGDSADPPPDKKQSEPKKNYKKKPNHNAAPPNSAPAVSKDEDSASASHKPSQRRDRPSRGGRSGRSEEQSGGRAKRDSRLRSEGARKDRRPHSADETSATAAAIADMRLSDAKEAWPSLGAEPRPPPQPDTQQAAKRMISSALGLRPRDKEAEHGSRHREDKGRGRKGRGKGGRERVEPPKGMSLGDFI